MHLQSEGIYLWHIYWMANLLAEGKGGMGRVQGGKAGSAPEGWGVLRRGGDCNFKEPGLGGFTTEVWELALVSGGTTFQAAVERELTQRSPVRPVLFCNLFFGPFIPFMLQ